MYVVFGILAKIPGLRSFSLSPKTFLLDIKPSPMATVYHITLIIPTSWLVHKLDYSFWYSSLKGAFIELFELQNIFHFCLKIHNNNYLNIQYMQLSFWIDILDV